MLQILFPLRLRPRSRWGAYSAPTPLAVFAVFKGPIPLGRDKGRGREGKEKGKEGERIE